MLSTVDKCIFMWKAEWYVGKDECFGCPKVGPFQTCEDAVNRRRKQLILSRKKHPSLTHYLSSRHGGRVWRVTKIGQNLVGKADQAVLDEEMGRDYVLSLVSK